MKNGDNMRAYGSVVRQSKISGDLIAIAQHHWHPKDDQIMENVSAIIAMIIMATISLLALWIIIMPKPSLPM
jgi:hypothetical protein